MQEQERGQEIMQAVFKASMQALFAIGVRSSDNVDKFTLHFSNALDREFLKIGLLPNQVDQLEAQADTSSRHVVEDTPEPNYSDIDEDKEFDESLATPLGASGFTTLDYGKSIAMIEALELKPLVTYHLKKAGITTIDELMTRMQQEALTTI